MATWWYDAQHRRPLRLVKVADQSRIAPPSEPFDGQVFLTFTAGYVTISDSTVSRGRVWRPGLNSF